MSLIFPASIFALRFYEDGAASTVVTGVAKSRYCTYLKPGGTGDRNDVFSLSQHPCQRDLAGGSIVFLPDPLQTVREFEDVGEVLLRVPWDYLAEVPILEVVRRFLRERKKFSGTS